MSFVYVRDSGDLISSKPKSPVGAPMSRPLLGLVDLLPLASGGLYMFWPLVWLADWGGLRCNLLEILLAGGCTTSIVPF